MFKYLHLTYVNATVMCFKKSLLILFSILPSLSALSQEGMPIYSDYLTDNYYLIHPSMAGVANCSKVRITARQQWFGVENAPSLQTMSFNTRVGDTPSAYGAIVYNDKNGYQSQTGAYLTYAHHLMFSRNEIDLNMLSFGLNAGVIQYRLDQTDFLSSGFDPIISGVNESATNFNVDVGLSYHFLDFYAHATVKNLLENQGVNFSDQGLSFVNSRTFLLTLGNTFNKIGSEWSYEPSIMLLHRPSTKEFNADINFKVQKAMNFGSVYGGLSYRTSINTGEFTDTSNVNNTVSGEPLTYITPFAGVTKENFMIAYTYSYQSNSLVFDSGGYHQITLGYNFKCRKRRYECVCPAINN